MKTLLGALALLALFSAAVLPPAPASAQQPPDAAQVVSWSDFQRLLNQRQVLRFTGVSGGYVAFMVCEGRWFRVRAAVADVVAELESRNYRPNC